MIYMDNASTSFPKAPGAPEAVAHYLTHVGAGPARGGYPLSQKAQDIVQRARERTAGFFNAQNPRNVIFTYNLTAAVNLCLYGFLKPGARVVTTSVEHNAVMRPLRHLEKARGIKITLAPCREDGYLDTGKFREALGAGADLVVINHASNVLGAVQPVEEIREMAGDTPLLLDTAQTGGIIPVDFQACGISMLAFSGHKSFMGPPGVGGLIIRDGLEQRLEPLVRGGTGSRSEEETQPDFLPDRYESGTPNTAGLAGLEKALEFVESKGAAAVLRHELELTGLLIQGLTRIKGVTLCGPGGLDNRAPLVSFTMDGLDSGIIGQMLWQDYGVAVRTGLHCAPSAHRTAGTYPNGSVRISPGFFNTADEVNRVLEAVSGIAALRSGLAFRKPGSPS